MRSNIELKKGVLTKLLYLLMITAAFWLTGCKTEDTMVNFIPTPIPEIEDSVDEGAVVDEEPTKEAEEATEATPAPVQIPAGQAKTMYVKLDSYGAFLNVRATPSTDGEKVSFLVHAEKVKVLGIENGWASIEYDGRVCYVSADYLVEERPEYIPAPTATPVPTKAPEVTKAAEGNSEEPATENTEENTESTEEAEPPAV